MSEYISRAAANNRIMESIVHQDSHDVNLHNIGLRKAMSAIDSLPAADVAEVVHASWVWNPDGMDWGIGAWVCGKCKSRPETWWNTVKECHPLRCSGSRYCGNCGAKMDGGQDDE